MSAEHDLGYFSHEPYKKNKDLLLDFESEELSVEHIEHASPGNVPIPEKEDSAEQVSWQSIESISNEIRNWGIVCERLISAQHEPALLDSTLAHYGPLIIEAYEAHINKVSFENSRELGEDEIEIAIEAAEQLRKFQLNPSKTTLVRARSKIERLSGGKVSAVKDEAKSTTSLRSERRTRKSEREGIFPCVITRFTEAQAVSTPWSPREGSAGWYMKRGRPVPPVFHSPESPISNRDKLMKELPQCPPDAATASGDEKTTANPPMIAKAIPKPESAENQTTQESSSTALPLSATPASADVMFPFQIVFKKKPKPHTERDHYFILKSMKKPLFNGWKHGNELEKLLEPEFKGEPK